SGSLFSDLTGSQKRDLSGAKTAFLWLFENAVCSLSSLKSFSAIEVDPSQFSCTTIKSYLTPSEAP
ncbi:hypothetical protein, partial [Enterococcus sp.]|uniref:hypothetical protein n=1 Tax=Enterococcus sp. TaxID=35783 RepID=UPI0029144A65